VYCRALAVGSGQRVEHRDVVRHDRRVGGHEGESVLPCLGDEQPVERITVMRRQRRDREAVVRRQAEDPDAVDLLVGELEVLADADRAGETAVRREETRAGRRRLDADQAGDRDAVAASV
jgi:hypothetical protein